LAADTSQFAFQTSQPSCEGPVHIDLDLIDQAPTPANLWLAIIRRLEIAKRQYVEVLEGCLATQLTDSMIEITAPTLAVAKFVHDGFRQRIEREAADILNGRALSLRVASPAMREVVAPPRARVGAR
jgi:hypothetical protein